MRAIHAVAVFGVGLLLATSDQTACANAQKATGEQPQAGAKQTIDQAEWTRISALLQSGDYEASWAAITRMTERDAFKAYPANIQHEVLGLRAGLALQLRHYPDALIAARRLTQFDEPSAGDWVLRVRAASALKDWDDAARSVLALTHLGREAVSELQPSFVVSLSGTYVLQTPNGRAMQGRLIDALFDCGWDNEASGLWVRRAADLIDGGDTARAALMLGKVTAASSRIQVSADRRFDTLRARVPDAFEVDGALARELEDSRVKAAASDASLKDGYTYALKLVERGRYEDGLSVVDMALARAEAEAAKPTGHPVDPDDLIWALDTRSRALVFLGRHDEAVAALRRASRRPERGSINVSHAINLGGLYDRIDRPADALDAVADIDATNVSSFGLMQLKEVQACAYFALGRTAELKATLTFIAAHAAEAPATVASTAFCTGDEETAAASLIARLEDPGQRLAALADVQDYIAPPHPTASDSRARALWFTVLARPDVSSAIDRFGHRRSWRVIGPQF